MGECYVHIYIMNMDGFEVYRNIDFNYRNIF